MDTATIMLIVFSIILVVVIGLVIFFTVRNSSEDIDDVDEVDSEDEEEEDVYEPDVTNVDYHVVVHPTATKKAKKAAKKIKKEARLLRKARKGGLEKDDCKDLCKICKKRDYEDCDEICDKCKKKK